MTHTGPNVHQAELDHFDKLAEQWWDADGPFKTLHDINPVRMAFILNYVSLEKHNVLDVGCGAGLLSESMAALGARVTAIDGAPNVIQAAQAHAQQQGLKIDYQTCTAEQFLLEQPAQFEIITCMELLEHVPEPAQLLQTLYGLLKPGGHLFLSTLNRNLKSYLYAIVAAEYLLNIVPRGTHHYEQFIKPNELDAALRGAQFTTQASRGYAYSPFSRQARLTDDVSVNYLMYARKY